MQDQILNGTTEKVRYGQLLAETETPKLLEGEKKMTSENTEKQKQENEKILSYKTGILDQARLRPHGTSQGPSRRKSLTH
jgi:hypothetical protein